ncbi:hypothetical protein, partial [Mesorhizobium japonicum]|uniref:hypothetical protein n=1 Tax=Mesorhizobium japonicum TaxID=2066070 RepID=UPI003B58E70D
MSIRITAAENKVAYIVVGYIVTVSAGVAVAVTADLAAGLLVYTALVVGFVGVGSRTFRGAGEDAVAPRPLWRMTARPTAGYIVAGLAALEAATFDARALARARAQGVFTQT